MMYHHDPCCIAPGLLHRLDFLPVRIELFLARLAEPNKVSPGAETSWFSLEETWISTQLRMISSVFTVGVVAVGKAQVQTIKVIICFSFRAACWLAGTLEYNGAVVDMISNTCNFSHDAKQSVFYRQTRRCFELFPIILFTHNPSE